MKNVLVLALMVFTSISFAQDSNVTEKNLGGLSLVEVTRPIDWTEIGKQIKFTDRTEENQSWAEAEAKIVFDNKSNNNVLSEFFGSADRVELDKLDNLTMSDGSTCNSSIYFEDSKEKSILSISISGNVNYNTPSQEQDAKKITIKCIKDFLAKIKTLFPNRLVSYKVAVENKNVNKAAKEESVRVTGKGEIPSYHFDYDKTMQEIIKQ